jgi:hypothetical protein
LQNTRISHAAIKLANPDPNPIPQTLPDSSNASQSLTRRSFLSSAALPVLPGIALAQSSAKVPCTLTLEPRKVVASVPENFPGLSYESAQLRFPNFFAPSNERLLAFVQTLSPRGVLRLGGNTSEFTIWSPTAPPAAPQEAIGPDTGSRQPRPRTVISQEAVKNLADFLKTARWQLIYGLNLGNGTPEQAAQEAKAVLDAAGDQVIALQIGNEPDLYHRNGLRPPNWTFQDYFAQWKQFADAVRRLSPHAHFAAPDVATNVEWITNFAQQGKSEIVEVTGHYYAEGPPENPAMNIERLLHPDPKLMRNISLIQRACRMSGLPYRMAETNSCYHGGKAGVSDTFAAALWGGDYMLQLMQAGFIGINFHGGGLGYYTPIAFSPQTGFSARPLYYGMLLAKEFAGMKLLQAELNSRGINATAYAAHNRSSLKIAIFNKDSQDISIRVQSIAQHRPARLWRLTAPQIDSKTGVTLAGAEVSRDGSWSPRREEHLSPAGNTLTIDVPAASAVLALL